MQSYKKASATSSPSRKAALPTYFLRSAVPSGGVSREYSGAWGRAGRGESWAGQDRHAHGPLRLTVAVAATEEDHTGSRERLLTWEKRQQGVGETS